ncbi:ribonuclease III [Mycoplasmopsis adleri]|uniref:ribonuclease III n=1 Tax=Mycoplasmopsis adleri TaxID=51362 RepID=UPI0038730341
MLNSFDTKTPISYRKSEIQKRFKIHEFKKFLEKYHIEVHNLDTYILALTHGSCHPHDSENNYQVLEFLGDAIIQFLASDFIFKKTTQDKAQGHLTLLRSQMVRTETLNQLSDELNLKHFLLIHPKFEKDKILKSEKVGADIFESLTAAIYLDNDLQTAKDFLYKTLFIETKDLFSYSNLKDYKTIFQEEVQLMSKKPVSYNTYQNGDHFVSEVSYDGIIYGIGVGKNKMHAEENAAKAALTKLIKK